MLYSIDIESAPLKRGDHHYEEWMVEAPAYRSDHVGITLPRGLRNHVESLAHDASIRWEQEVVVTISRYFPARVGYLKDNGSCVRSVLGEFKRFYRRQDHLGVAK